MYNVQCIQYKYFNMINIESERGRDKVKSKRYRTLIAQMHSPPCFPKQETHSSCQWLIPFGDTHKRTAHTLCIEHQRKSEMCCICCCITSNLFDNKETVFLLPMGINLILFLSLRLSLLVHLHSAFSILCPLSLFVDFFSLHLWNSSSFVSFSIGLFVRKWTQQLFRVRIYCYRYNNSLLRFGSFRIGLIFASSRLK